MPPHGSGRTPTRLTINWRQRSSMFQKNSSGTPQRFLSLARVDQLASDIRAGDRF